MHKTRKAGGDKAMSSISEERAILDAAREICAQLKISRRFDLQRVVWTSKGLSDECEFTPGVRRTGLVLPVQLRGTITVEEWRPIIVASLMRFKDGQRFLQLFIRSFALLISIAGIGFLAYLILGASLALLALPVAIFASFLMLRSYSRWMKQEALKLDGKTWRIVGRDPFLHVLSKIDAMELKDIEMLKQRRGFTARVLLGGKPSITERITFIEEHSE